MTSGVGVGRCVLARAMRGGSATKTPREADSYQWNARPHDGQQVYTAFVDYYRNDDFYERLQRGVDAMAGLRADIQRSRENPVYLEQRIDEGMMEFRRLTMLAVRYNVTNDVIDYAEGVVRTLRAAWKFFHYLSQEIPMTADDDATNERLEHISLEDDNDKALSLLLARDEITPGKMSYFAKKHDRHAQKAGIPPLQVRLIVNKLDSLQLRLTRG